MTNYRSQLAKLLGAAPRLGTPGSFGEGRSIDESALDATLATLSKPEIAGKTENKLLLTLHLQQRRHCCSFASCLKFNHGGCISNKC